jgi:hypothetical protein
MGSIMTTWKALLLTLVVTLLSVTLAYAKETTAHNILTTPASACELSFLP